MEVPHWKKKKRKKEKKELGRQKWKFSNFMVQNDNNQSFKRQKCNLVKNKKYYIFLYW